MRGVSVCVPAVWPPPAPTPPVAAATNVTNDTDAPDDADDDEFRFVCGKMGRDGSVQD